MLDTLDLGPCYVAADADGWAQGRAMSATRLVKVLGLSTFAPAAALDAYDEIVNGVTTPAGSAARWGLALEQMLIGQLSTYTGREYLHLGQVALARRDRPHHRASVDALAIHAPIVAECKTTTTTARRQWGTPGTDEIPDFVRVQVQWQLWVTGRESADMIVGWTDRRSEDFYFQMRDEAMISTLCEVADDFWAEHVVPQIPPDPMKYCGALTFPVRKSYSGRPSYKAAFHELMDEHKRIYQETIRDAEAQIQTATDDMARTLWAGRADEARAMLHREDVLGRMVLARHGGAVEG